jgi:pimeloyl-ACP methyl ester carboxylesterase
MAPRKLLGLLSAAASAATLVAYARYRKDIRSIRDEVDRGSTIAETTAGPIEYAQTGRGEPLLMIHGAGGGYDQGLLIARDFAEAYRVIAPSRFGYLKTPVPQDSSPAAQADAHAALLDFLKVKTCVVVGVSAGAPSAVELALRHRERVSALILLVPRTYDPSQSIGADQSVQSRIVLRLIEASADFLFWLATRVVRPSVVRFLGSPPEVEAAASAEDRQRVTDVMRSVLPVSSRIRGIAVDSNIELSPWPVERMKVPVLIVSAKDDLWRTLPGARFTAERIPGAELHVLEDGGHLMIGHEKRVTGWIRGFLAAHKSSNAHRGTSKKAAPVKAPVPA